jgi:hypothetical protein
MQIQVRCPKCGEEHNYSLVIKRLLVMSANPATAAKSTKHTFLVTCPKTDGKFAVDLTLEDKEGQPILSIDALLVEKSG